MGLHIQDIQNVEVIPQQAHMHICLTQLAQTPELGNLICQGCIKCNPIITGHALFEYNNTTIIL
jgi:hypothetical protein